MNIIIVFEKIFITSFLQITMIFVKNFPFPKKKCMLLIGMNNFRKRFPLKINDAFLYRNFQKFTIEEKVISLSHVFTILFCFFPWTSHEPLYGETYTQNAFGGPTLVIGTVIFLISCTVTFFWANKLLQKKWWPLRVSDNKFLWVAGWQQLLLLFCATSVLLLVGRGFENSELRMGMPLCFVAQVAALTATFLRARDVKKNEVMSFFQHPTKDLKNKPSPVAQKLFPISEEKK
jgi:hypothetical protein